MPTSRYKAVVDELASAIRTGRLSPGTRLATHRELAEAEGMAVVTATKAYRELEAMGLVSSERGRGTFVRDQRLPTAHRSDYPVTPGAMADLVLNAPASADDVELLRQGLRDLAASGDLQSLLGYKPHRGRQQDRIVVAAHLRQRGVPASADRVLVVSGAQHGLAVTTMGLLRAGDVVAVDALTYPGFKVLAHSLGLELAAVPAAPDGAGTRAEDGVTVVAHDVDAASGHGGGPDLELLERLCRARTVRAAYVMPTLHNPLGWVMDLAARERLVSIARRHDLLLIEDASYAYLCPQAPPPLAQLAPERTVYVSGLSKNLANGLRVGHLAAPASMVEPLERAVRATTWNTPAVITAMTCRWLADGTIDRLEVERRLDARARQRLAAEALVGLSQVTHPSSYFTWVPLPESARADRIAAALWEDGIAVSTAEAFSTGTHVPQAVRIALASLPMSALRDALLRVREVIKSDSLL